MSPHGLQRMAAGREWLDAAHAIQCQVVQEFGQEQEAGLALLRSATHRFPELRQVAVYARNNLARDGHLSEGDVCPDVRLLPLQREGPGCAGGGPPQVVTLHSVVAGADKATVLCAGSYS